MLSKTFLIATLALLTGCGGGQQAKVENAASAEEGTAETGSETAPEEPEINPLDEPVAELIVNRCASKVGENDVLVLSKQDGYATLLGGAEWTIQCDDEQMLVAESPYGMHVTVRGSNPPSAFAVESHLMKMATRVADKMVTRGFPVSPPTAVEIEVGHQTVEAVFISIDLTAVAPNMMQINYWTARQRDDGVVLDFHMSAVIPTDKGQQVLDGTILVMERTTGLFTLLEDLDLPE
ncbi:MAG: hypothetical protein WBG86_00310 [Polyangiales bacterium]